VVSQTLTVWPWTSAANSRKRAFTNPFYASPKLLPGRDC
jgi:hypothetical protein